MHDLLQYGLTKIVEVTCISCITKLIAVVLEIVFLQ